MIGICGNTEVNLSSGLTSTKRRLMQYRMAHEMRLSILRHAVFGNVGTLLTLLLCCPRTVRLID